MHYTTIEKYSSVVKKCIKKLFSTFTGYFQAIFMLHYLLLPDRKK